jgi:hypothetical protein
MALAAVTAASAAAALVPFEMSLKCLPAKGNSGYFYDRMARLVDILDGHDLPGHCTCLIAARRSLD